MANFSSNFRSLTAGLRFKNPPKTKKDSVIDKLDKDDNDDVAGLRKKNKIRVDGTDVPDPITSWSNLRERYSISENLVNSSIYRVPTPIQMQSIPIMMEGRDILASAPTGSGKTAAYLIPILHRLGGKSLKRRNGIGAVIVCPTRELSQQIYREALKFASIMEDDDQNHRVTTIVLTKDPSQNRNWKGIDIVISTPNRLVYSINDGILNFESVEWLILDESDKLFESNGDRGFRDQISVIYKACLRSKKALFSATLAPDVETWCKLNLNNDPISVIIGIRNEASQSVQQELIYTGNEKGKIIGLRNLIRDGSMKPPILIFVQEIERANELLEFLTKDEKLKANVIHSKMSLLQREDAIKQFRSGRTWILICTELMSRGIDFKGVHLVINYDFPPSTVSYIHRVGRTGRAGRHGRALTFFTDQDKTLLRSIAQIVHSSGNSVPDYTLKLKKASRQEKRKLASKAVKRETIKRESLYDKRKRERKAKMIEASKRRKSKNGDEIRKEKENKNVKKRKRIEEEEVNNEVGIMTDKKTKKKKRARLTKECL